MSLIPIIFGNRRSDSFDPFSLDPFEVFPSPSSVPILPPSVGAMSAVGYGRIDWKETPQAHVFKVDVPGLRKEEVKVEVQDGTVLQISGERIREQEEKNDKWHRVERNISSFQRQFRLPENTKLDEVKAAMDKGVLTVTVPKEEEAKKREVRFVDIFGGVQ